MDKFDIYIQDNIFLLSSEKNENTILFLNACVGSNNDPENQKGIAHLCEHISLFHHPINGGQSFTPYYNSSGLTKFDHTTIKYVIPNDEHTKQQIKLILNGIIEKFHITNKEFADCLKKIRNEYLYTGMDDISSEIEKYKFITGNIVKSLPVGVFSSINKMTIQEAQAFVENYYIAENMMICIISNLRIDELKKIVMKYQSKVPTNSYCDRKSPLNDRQTNFMRIEKSQMHFPRIECYINVEHGINIKKEKILLLLSEVVIERYLNNCLNSQFEYKMCNIVVSELNIMGDLNYLYMKFDYLDKKMLPDSAVYIVEKIKRIRMTKKEFNQIITELCNGIKTPDCNEFDYLLNNITQHYLYNFPLHLDDNTNGQLISTIKEITFDQLRTFLIDLMKGTTKIIFTQ